MIPTTVKSQRRRSRAVSRRLHGAATAGAAAAVDAGAVAATAGAAVSRIAITRPATASGSQGQ